MPEIYNFGIQPLNLSADFERGQEKARQRGLRSLAGDYYDKQNPMLGQLARLGGDAAGMQKDMQGQEDRKREQLGQFASLLTSAPAEMRPGLYRQMHAQLSQIVPDAPPEYSPEIDGLAQQIAAQYAPQNATMPAGLREFQGMTQGMSAADVAKARRVALGLDSRASSGLPYGFMEVEGPDGVKRVVMTNKREGGAATLAADGSPQGAGAPQGQMPPIQLAGLLQTYGGKVTSGYRDPGHNAAVGGVPNSFHKTGQAIDVVMPNATLRAQAKQLAQAQGYQVIDEGDHLHIEPPGSPSGPNPFASRPAEQQAALTAGATENAKIGAQVANTGAVARSEAQIAAAKAQAEARAKAQGEREATSDQRTYNADRTISLLDEADRLITGSTGSGAGVVRDKAAAFVGRSTAGAENIAALKPIAAQLISMIPRMEGPQSDKDVELYRQAAGDLANPALPVGTRKAASAQIRRLNAKYASQQNAPATGDARRKALLDKY